MASQNSSSSTTSFSATMLYAVCLIVGLLIGYLVRGNTDRLDKPAAKEPAQAASSVPPAGMPSQMPSLEQMKHMADKKAEPLLAKLKTDPNNAALLLDIGRVYESAHQFKDAVAYFDKSLAVDPKNLNAISEKAGCLFYSGDVDNAISVLNAGLQYSPRDPRVLFNLGMMHWQGKGDAKGAIELWQKLLKTNPALDSQRKAQVEALIKQASTHQAAHLTGS